MSRNKRRIIIPCKTCGNDFEIRPCENGLIVNCSKNCSLKYRSNNSKGRLITWADKIGLANKGRKNNHCKTDEYRKNHSMIMKAVYANGCKTRIGRKDSEEVKIKKSLAQLGHNRGGWKHSLETRKKMSESKKGDKTHLWKGGICNVNSAIRTSFEYKEWRKSVFIRDDYTCQLCGIVGGKLQADHIKQFAYYPELRFDINNGRSLCVPCHKQTPTYLKGGIKKTHKFDIVEI